MEQVLVQDWQQESSKCQVCAYYVPIPFSFGKGHCCSWTWVEANLDFPQVKGNQSACASFGKLVQVQRLGKAFDIE